MESAAPLGLITFDDAVVADAAARIHEQAYQLSRDELEAELANLYGYSRDTQPALVGYFSALLPMLFRI